MNGMKKMDEVDLDDILVNVEPCNVCLNDDQRYASIAGSRRSLEH